MRRTAGADPIRRSHRPRSLGLVLPARSQRGPYARRRPSFVVLANRLPVRRDGDAWCTSPGGLVSALVPILQQREGVWIGWCGVPDQELAPFEHDGIRNVPVAISAEELEGYYEGFANGALWPLYHGAIRGSEFRREWWRAYVKVNRRFAQHAARVAGQGALVWVQDYHLQLVPRMLRELRPDLCIGFFLHTPLPPDELFSRLPWRRELVEGLLGADLVGFQTGPDARHFEQLAALHAGADTAGGALRHTGRTVLHGAFPISIDFERFERLARTAAVRRRAAELRREVGAGRRVLLGVDRLDYSKGIDARLLAYQRLLREGRVRAEDTVFVQTVVPSRESVAQYAEQREKVERLVGEINGEFGQLGRPPVHYLRCSMPAEELAAFYVAADAMLVTPLRDGMNLIAKEYVATRTQEDGVLVLSERAGAAAELKDALLVNPFDLEGLADGVERALRLPAPEVARRMRALRAQVRGNDVYSWAERFLCSLERPTARTVEPDPRASAALP